MPLWSQFQTSSRAIIIPVPDHDVQMHILNVSCVPKTSTCRSADIAVPPEVANADKVAVRLGSGSLRHAEGAKYGRTMYLCARHRHQALGLRASLMAHRGLLRIDVRSRSTLASSHSGQVLGIGDRPWSRVNGDKYPCIQLTHDPTSGRLGHNDCAGEHKG